MVRFCPNTVPCLTAVVLLACSTLEARSLAFLVESQSTKLDLTTSNIQFSITFNQPFIPGGPTAFQYFTPDSLIRGGERSDDIIPIRSYGPPDLGDPSSGGWGPIIALVPFSLSGDTVDFSAPFDLFSSSPQFTYRIETYYEGVYQGYVQGNTVPEPATWAMMLLGFAGLGYAGYRKSWKHSSFAA
jgi:hypothetical protein